MEAHSTCGSASVRHISAPGASESFFGTLKSEWLHHERLMDAETTKHLAIEFIESYYNRYRPHEAIGDRVPAEVMDEFFMRFEDAMSYETEVNLAA
ncbi:MAG: integrase core domain-containing protein [Atopobiaceae bacterium]|nr:integrase core domain-containing protein [Atopobiaceae bacterium]